MHCPNCGAKNEDNSLFCYQCGTSLAAPAQPSTPAPTQPVLPPQRQNLIVLAAAAVAIIAIVALVFVVFRQPPPTVVVVVTPGPALTQAPYPTYTPYPTPTRLQFIQKEFDVYANQDWQNSGVYVEKASVAMIEYVSGKWSPWSGLYVDGRGCLDERLGCSQDPNHPTNIFPAKHGALIGRVGNQMFAVGNLWKDYAPSSGYIYFRINDYNINDDSGSIRVRLTTFTQ